MVMSLRMDEDRDRVNWTQQSGKLKRPVKNWNDTIR